jgi:RNA polymerase sigma-70 factor (ECF subfamily)
VTAEPESLRELRLALTLGDRIAVESVLDDAVVLVADRGRDSSPVRGRAAVARALLAELGGLSGRVVLGAHDVNGETGIVARADGRVVAVLLAELRNDGVVAVWLVTSPAQLARWW